MKKVILLAILFCICISVAPSYASERVAVLGAKTTLIPPSEFVPAQNFPGFMLEEAGSSIMVTEIPGPFSEISEGFTADGVAARGMSLLSKEAVSGNPNSGALFHLSQQAYGVQYLKWMYIYGSEANTTMVTATFPAELEQYLSQKMKTSILTARTSEDRQIDPFEGLQFTIEESLKFKIAKRMSNMLILTEGGGFEPKPNPDPALIIGSSISQVFEIENKKEFSIERAQATKAMNNIEIESSKDISINGLSGFEIIANSTNAKTQDKQFLYQVIIFEGGGYYLIQGIGPRVLKEASIPEFKTIVSSFKII